MKKIQFTIIFQLIALLLIFSGCQDKYTEEYLSAEPVYMSYKDLREAVKTETVHSLEKPGNIFYKVIIIYINEIL